MSHSDILNLLFDVAENTDTGWKNRVASCIKNKKRIISIGTNNTKSHTFQKKFGKVSDCIFWHAETNAIFKAIKRNFEDFSAATLYVARIKKPNNALTYNFGLAKPCRGCMECIRYFGFRKVIYSTDHNSFEVLTP